MSCIINSGHNTPPPKQAGNPHHVHEDLPQETNLARHASNTDHEDLGPIKWFDNNALRQRKEEMTQADLALSLWQDTPSDSMAQGRDNRTNSIITVSAAHNYKQTNKDASRKLSKHVQRQMIKQKQVQYQQNEKETNV